MNMYIYICIYRKRRKIGMTKDEEGKEEKNNGGV